MVRRLLRGEIGGLERCPRADRARRGASPAAEIQRTWPSIASSSKRPARWPEPSGDEPLGYPVAQEATCSLPGSVSVEIGS